MPSFREDTGKLGAPFQCTEMKPAPRIEHSLLPLTFGVGIALWLIPSVNQQQTVSPGQSQHYEVVSGSIYDGDSLHIHPTSAGIHTQLRRLSHPQLRQGKNGRA